MYSSIYIRVRTVYEQFAQISISTLYCFVAFNLDFPQVKIVAYQR